MAGSASSGLRRSGRDILAVAALVLALGGVGASPASANQRAAAVNEANNVINACMKAAGDPFDVFSDSRHVGVFCDYGDVLHLGGREWLGCPLSLAAQRGRGQSGQPRRWWRDNPAGRRDGQCTGGGARGERWCPCEHQ
jgi:hypothetical protein